MSPSKPKNADERAWDAYGGPASPHDQEEVRDALELRSLPDLVAICNEGIAAGTDLSEALLRCQEHETRLRAAFEAMRERAKRLHDDALLVLSKAGVPVRKSSFRAKSIESILRQLEEREWSRPVYDIYGARFAVEEEHTLRAVAALRRRWPTPLTLPTGRNAVLMGALHYSTDGFEMARCNLLIGDGRIGEVQVLTLENFERELAGRAEFEAARAAFWAARRGGKT